MATDDAEIERRFLAASLPIALLDSLLAFLEGVHYPLAVRSSSLLEDSQYQPFSGVYETFMLANRHPDIQVRLEQLLEAIKLVYASTFSQHAKSYVRATPYRLEEEKMAVVVQQVVGAAHGNRFYPDFSGVVRSRNFYPMPPIKVEDGIRRGRTGTGTRRGRRRKMPDLQSASSAQPGAVLVGRRHAERTRRREFWALELSHDVPTGDPANALREVPFGLAVAEADGTLQMLASTYSRDNHAVYDGVSRQGPRSGELRAHSEARPVSFTADSGSSDEPGRGCAGSSGGD